jgi:hypothetical protein
MKPHFILKFKQGVVTIEAPYWADFIENKSGAVESLGKEIDLVLQKHKMKCWITHEFKPKNSNHSDLGTVTWSKDEVDAGLDRIYRVISQEDKAISAGLIEELKLNILIEKVYPGEISVTKLPEHEMAVTQELIVNKPSQQIFLEEAHLFSKGNSDIRIAVLDTGVDYTHPEIKHAMVEGMDFVDIINGADKFIGDFLGDDTEPQDEVGHGSHVAGIICAKGIKMPIGVVPECKIIPVRVLGAMNNGGRLVGAGLIDNISTGIKWAVDKGANIINMSLGVKHSGGGLPHKEVIAYALKKGVTVVAASGNDGTNDKYYPGALNRVIAVGAVDYSDTITGFSTYGNHISLVAPGFHIYSAGLNHGYSFASGTSQASPFVAGSIALLKSYSLTKGKKLNDDAIKFILKVTADRNFKGYKDIKYGHGKINLIDAIKYINYHFKNL